jgi:hypothetical protein
MVRDPQSSHGDGHCFGNVKTKVQYSLPMHYPHGTRPSPLLFLPPHNCEKLGKRGVMAVVTTTIMATIVLISLAYEM